MTTEWKPNVFSNEKFDTREDRGLSGSLRAYRYPSDHPAICVQLKTECRLNGN